MFLHTIHVIRARILHSLKSMYLCIVANDGNLVRKCIIRKRATRIWKYKVKAKVSEKKNRTLQQWTNSYSHSLECICHPSSMTTTTWYKKKHSWSGMTCYLYISALFAFLWKINYNYLVGHESWLMRHALETS